MYMDSPLAIYTENDGIASLMHCEEWNFVSFIRIEYSESSLKYGVYSVIKQKVFERDLLRARYAKKFNYKTLNFPWKNYPMFSNSIIKHPIISKIQL